MKPMETFTQVILGKQSLLGDAGQRSIENCEGDFLIGRHKNGSAPWLGDIDEMVIARKALSQDELEALMNKGIMQFSLFSHRVTWLLPGVPSRQDFRKDNQYDRTGNWADRLRPLGEATG